MAGPPRVHLPVSVVGRAPLIRAASFDVRQGQESRLTFAFLRLPG